MQEGVEVEPCERELHVLGDLGTDGEVVAEPLQVDHQHFGQLHDLECKIIFFIKY